MIILGISLTGCASNMCVQKSKHVITTLDESVVYIKDSEIGQHLYKYYNEGIWGEELIVVMLDTTQFNELYENSISSSRR